MDKIALKFQIYGTKVQGLDNQNLSIQYNNKYYNNNNIIINLSIQKEYTISIMPIISLYYSLFWGAPTFGAIVNSCPNHNGTHCEFDDPQNSRWWYTTWARTCANLLQKCRTTQPTFVSGFCGSFPLFVFPQLFSRLSPMTRAILGIRPWCMVGVQSHRLRSDPSDQNNFLVRKIYLTSSIISLRKLFHFQWKGTENYPANSIRLISMGRKQVHSIFERQNRWLGVSRNELDFWSLWHL